ncbi:MAG: HepT-like ribonuclease domain-containing protein, partial [Planctomycetota bacterium]
ERLAHMLEYARMAQRISAGRQREHLDTDVEFSLAIVRALEVVGEAAAQVSPAGRARAPGIPWPQIVGLRNRIVHGYDTLDRKRIWDIISADLDPLVTELEKLVPPEPPA